MHDFRPREPHNADLMTERPHPTTHADGAAGTAEPEVLLRLPIDGGDWADHVPPSPRGHDVSVSFGSQAARRRHGAVLDALGYRIVDVRDHPAPGEYADIVLRKGTAETTPAWWRALAALAERAYPLALGPAATRWAALVDRHEQAAVATRHR